MGDDFRCDACGEIVPAAHLLDVSLRCPNFGRDDGDHVLRPGTEPQLRRASPTHPSDGNPLVLYRETLTAYRVAMQSGWTDDRFVSLVQELDSRVSRVDGRGFRETPLRKEDGLAQAIGLREPAELWVKDETGNVAGSHKARHLAGVMLYLQVISSARGASLRAERSGALAIASCGNAALAAAVVAQAGARALQVFVPSSADQSVLVRLRALGAAIATCDRRAHERGDPCYLRFHEAVAGGALPFCCQGPDNALTVEGGCTLAWEVVDHLRDTPPDRVFVQVGGGAFAASCARAWRAAADAGEIPRLPRLHPVQTAGGFPLVRAWAFVALRTLERMLLESEQPDLAVPADIVQFGAERVIAALRAWANVRGDDEESIGRALAVDHRALRACADGLASEMCVEAARAVLRDAARARSSFMWPWEREPRSRAHGILDDETYDWREVLEGTMASGGWPIIAKEAQIQSANRLGREATGIDADHTGTSGLAGLLALTETSVPRQPLVSPDERIIVIFSGVRRQSSDPDRVGRS